MKHTRLVILGLVVSLIGQSCSAPKSSNQTIVSNFPKEKLTIKIWSPLEDEKGYQTEIKNYRKQHKNVSFEYTHIDPADYDQEVIEALATGSGPDIIVIRNDELPKYQDKLVAMPDSFYGGSSLVAAVSTKYAPAVSIDAIADNKVYGVPLYTNTLAVFYNKALFDAAFSEKLKQKVTFDKKLLTTVPADWSELVETTKLLTKRDGDGFARSAIALGASNNVPHSAEITAALMMQQGAALVSEDRQNATFHVADNQDPTFYPGAAVMNFLKGFVDPNSPYYTWNASQPDAVQAFLDGKLAMMIHDISISPYLRQRNPDLRFATAAFPQIANTETIVDSAYYHLHTITNNSEYPQVAWDFLRQIDQSGAGYANPLGLNIALRSTAASTTVKARKNRDGPFSLQLPTARSWYKGTEPREVDAILNRALDVVTRQGTNSRQAVDAAAGEVTDLLKE